VSAQEGIPEHSGIDPDFYRVREITENDFEKTNYTLRLFYGRIKLVLLATV
jgi:hypothetical protein